MKKRNSAVDFAKFAASMLVVAIHVNLFSDVGEKLNFLTVQIICRLAVPFFAICTGFFLCKSMSFGQRLENSAQNRKTVFKQWKKTVLLYGVWTLIYMLYSIPFWIEIGWFSPFAFVDYAVGAVTKGSHYHFWYLHEMIIALPIFYVVLRTVPKNFFLHIAGGIWVFKMATGAYRMFLPDFAFFDLLEITEKILRILPFLFVGAAIALGTRKSRSFYATGLAVSSLCLTAEAFLLKNAGQDAVSYILFTLPAGYFLMQLLLEAKVPVPEKICAKLGEISIFIYCAHPMILETTTDIINSSILHFLFASVVSALLGLAVTYIKEKIIGKKAKKCSS